MIMHGHLFGGLVFLSPCTVHLYPITHSPENPFLFIPIMHEFLCTSPHNITPLITPHTHHTHLPIFHTHQTQISNKLPPHTYPTCYLHHSLHHPLPINSSFSPMDMQPACMTTRFTLRKPEWQFWFKPTPAYVSSLWQWQSKSCSIITVSVLSVFRAMGTLQTD